MQKTNSLLGQYKFSSFSTKSARPDLDELFSVSTHPFEHLTKVHGEIVSFQGDVYIPCKQTTEFQLTSWGSKRNLLKIGSVESQLKIPPSKTIFSTQKSVCDQAVYYYGNPSKTETDLLRFADSKYRRQYFIDAFSQPFYFKGSSVYGSGTLSPASVAIFRNKKKTIAFEDNRSITNFVDDVMSTSPGGKIAALKLGAADRLVYCYVEPGTSASTVNLKSYVQKHSIRAIGRNFNFDGCILDLTCYFSQNAVQLKDYPRVVTPEYKHFFVHVDGEICYNGDERFVDIGLRRGKWYSLSDKFLGYKIARVLEQGYLNLTQGFTRDCKPVNKPETLLELAV